MCVRCISLTINESLCLRSTRTKATSSTAKPRGSTSASPWWTSSRSASGYRRSCLRRRWRRRAKTRVSLASLCPRILPLLIRFACPNLHPVPVPEAQHLAYSRPRYATLSPALCSIWFCIWTPPCPHAEPETAFFPADWRSNSTSILPPHPLIPPPEFRSQKSAPPSGEPTQTDDQTRRFFWNIPKDLTGSGLLHSGMDQLLKKAAERKHRLSRRLWSCEDEEHLIAHYCWACILMRIETPGGKTLAVHDGRLEMCGKQEMLLFLKLWRTLMLDCGCVFCSYSM